jgi:hypothetical protein
MDAAIKWSIIVIIIIKSACLQQIPGCSLMKREKYLPHIEKDVIAIYYY